MTESESYNLEKESSSSPPLIFLGLRVSAIVEIFLFIAALLIINQIFGDGKRYIHATPHPFWILIILISIQYGMKEGLLAVVFSIIALYAGNVPPQEPNETLFEYQVRLAWNPVFWFITAFVLGQIKKRHDSDRELLLHNLERSEKETKAITEAYISLKGMKENLEAHLAGQLKTTAAIFKSFKSLGSINPNQILINLPAVVVPVLNPKKFSVYSFGPNGFEPVMAYGWSQDEKYKRRFNLDDPLSQCILKGQKIVTIVNTNDRKIFRGEGILAAPLIDSETHEIFGMLKVEEMDVYELNLSSLETFKMLCELIGISYTNARQYKKLEDNTIYPTDVPYFSYNFYKLQIEILKKVMHAAQLPLTQMNIKFEYHPSEGQAETTFVSSVLYILLKEVLPDIAYVCHGRRKWMDFIIVLPGIGETEISQLKDKLMQAIKGNDILSQRNVIIELESIG